MTAPKRAVQSILAHEDREGTGSLVLLRAVDLRSFLDERSLTLHGDVLDALAELVVELIDQEAAHVEGQDH